MFLGDQVQAANYNAVLGPAAGPHRCFSVQLGEPSDLGQYLLDPLDYRHPMLAPFRGHERAGLLTTPVWKYVNMTRDAQSTATVVLGFQHGAPAIVEEAVGSGRIILVATDASSVSWDRSTDPPTPWSAWVSWPSFPPLVQQMLRTAVGSRARLRNVVVGESLQDTLPAGSAVASVLITDPLGAGSACRSTWMEGLVAGRTPLRAGRACIRFPATVPGDLQ